MASYADKIDIQALRQNLQLGLADAGESRGLARGAADLGLEFASGVARGVKFTADAFGADNTVSRGAGKVDEFVRELLSAQAKEDDERVAEIMAEAEGQGVLAEVMAAGRAFMQKPFGMAANALGTSAPVIAAAMTPGLNKASAGARLGALAGMGAVQGAGVVKGEIHESVKAAHEEGGMSPQEAEYKARLAQSYGGPNAGNIVGGAALGAGAMATGVQPVLARATMGLGAGANNAREFARAAGMGVMKEMVPEAAQGGQERYASNVALQREGFDQPTFAGVAGNATLEGLAAGPMGGATGIMEAKGPSVSAPVRDYFALTEPLPPTQARTATLAKFDELAAGFGLNPAAAEKVKAQAMKMAAGDVPGFLARATEALNKRNLFGRPVDEQGMAELRALLGAQQETDGGDATQPVPPQSVAPVPEKPPAEIPGQMGVAPAEAEVDVEQAPADLPPLPPLRPDAEAIMDRERMALDRRSFAPEPVAAPRATAEPAPQVIGTTPQGDPVIDDGEYLRTPDGQFAAAPEPTDERVPDVQRTAGALAGSDLAGSADALGGRGDVRPDADVGRDADRPAETPEGRDDQAEPVAVGADDFALKGDEDLATMRRLWFKAAEAGQAEQAQKINDAIVEMMRVAREQATATADLPAPAGEPAPEPVRRPPPDAAAPGAPDSAKRPEAPAAGREAAAPSTPNAAAPDTATPSAPDAAAPGAAAPFDPKAGDSLTLDGNPWTVTKAGKAAITLKDAQGKGKTVQRGAPTWKKLEEQTAAKAAEEAFEHAGLRIYPTRTRGADGKPEARWAVQLPENKGTNKFLGDTLHRTVEEAKAEAEHAVRQDAKRREDLARLDAEEKARADARQAGRGKSIQDRRANAALEREVTESGKRMTRRQWVEGKVADGLKPAIKQEDKIKPMSRTQFNRATNEEQRAHERRIKAAGKKDTYWIGDYEVTKTEYDYAQQLALEAQNKDATQAQEEASPPAAPVAAESADSAARPAEVEAGGVTLELPATTNRDQAQPPRGSNSAPRGAGAEVEADGVRPLTQTFEQWAQATLDASEYKAAYLEAANGDRELAAVMAVQGNDDPGNPKQLRDLSREQHWRVLMDAPRDATLSLEVYDSLTPGQQSDALRHYFKLEKQLNERDSKALSERMAAESAKRAPYEAALSAVEAELKRLDAKPGPMTKKMSELGVRRARLQEAIYQIGQGQEPDGRLLRTQPTPAPNQPQAQAGTPAQGAETSRPTLAEPQSEQPAAPSATTDAQPAAPASPEPAAEQEGARKIEDFGQKLEGARKDYATTLKDAELVDIAAEPLSKSWPEPDYQKLLDDGADPFVVSFVRAVRDEVPTKPQKAWKLKGWVDTVKGFRETARSIMAGEVAPERVRSIAAKAGPAMKDALGRAELYELVGHGRSLKGVTFAQHYYAWYKGQENVTKWAVEQKAKATMFSNWPRELAVADTKDEALRIFKEKIGSLDLGAKAKGQPQFVVYSKRGQPGAFVGKKIGREYIDLHKADDIKAARAYMQTNAADLEKALEAYRSTPFERKTENEPRVGDDHRNGAPVTAEIFAETFGFRGVQFGNYVEQGRRQSDLNEAFDGLMDLAAVLGVPPRALSLNGQLGLAFGARGRGGKGAAAAHYEPDMVVINLTKGGGPGALAHEWWHAADNYFAKQGGATGFVTAGAKPDQLREQMRAAFAAVKLATSSPGYQARARELDKRRSKPYWNTPEERSARAFESYVIAKLQDQGVSNDYLSNVVSKQFWDASEALRAGMFTEGKPAESYPYPIPAEMPNVRAAFDDFFKTVQTRADDAGNVAMFARTMGDPSTAAAQDRITSVTDIVDVIRDTWASPPDVEVVWDLQDPKVPADVRAEDSRQRQGGAVGVPAGFFYKGKVYIVASAATTEADVARTLFHEALGHAGLRAAFGDGLNGLLDQMAVLYRPAVEAKAKQYGLDMAKPGQRRAAAEEVLAELAETRPTSTWVKKAVAAIKQWLRDNLPGVFGDMKMTDADIIAQFIVPARNAIERGKAGADGTVMFSRTADQSQTPAVRAETPPAITKLNRVMRQAGWELDYVDLDLTGEKPKANIRVNRGDGRFLIAKVDSIGRASFETFQRERNLRMDSKNPQARLSTHIDDTFLGRQRFEGPRAMLRSMVNYLTDNATGAIELADMRAAWAGVMAAPTQQTQALPAAASPPEQDVLFSRTGAQQEAKALGLPASGTTAQIRRLVDIANADPRTWTREDFDLIAPHLSVHQDVREGAADRMQSILSDGLAGGMVDSVGNMIGGKAWTWARGLVGKPAYVFISGGLKYKGSGNPWLAPGNKPLFAVAPKQGQDFFDALQTAVMPDRPMPMFSRTAAALTTDTDIDRAWRDLIGRNKFADYDTPAATKVTGEVGDFVLSREDGKRWVALNVREFNRDDGETVYTSSLEVGTEGFPSGTGAATTMYLQALHIAQRRGMGWQSEGVRSDRALAIYKRLTDAGVPFQTDGGAAYVSAEEMKNVDLAAVAQALAGDRPMPMFSRTAAAAVSDAIRSTDLGAKVADAYSDWATSQKVFTPGLKHVQTQLHKAKRDPGGFGKVFYAVQGYMRDVSRLAVQAAEEAPEVLRQIESLGDVGREIKELPHWKKRRADMKAASDALFDGTRFKTRDDAGNVIPSDSATDGVVWTNAELKARGMSERAIRMYQQSRAAIDRSLDSLLASDTFRRLQAIDPSLVFDTPTQRDELLKAMKRAASSGNPAEAVKLAREQVADKLAGMDKALEGQPNQHTPELMKRRTDLRKVEKELADKNRRIAGLKKSAYAPLMRFGQYAVAVRDAEGKVIAFHKFESEFAANRQARKLRESPEAAEGKIKVDQSILSTQDYKQLEGLSPEMAEMFADMLGVERTEAFNLWLENAVAEHSALKRLLPRKGTEGFEDDGQRVLAAFVTSNARLAARGLHSADIETAVTNIPKGDVKDEASRLRDYVNDPKEEAQAIRSLLFVNYIGGSVASAAVNLTQTFIQTFPHLSQYGGAAKAGNRVAQAMRLAMGKTIADPKLAAAVRQAELDGVIKPQEVFHLQAEVSRNLSANPLARSLLTTWGSLFQLAEQYNRRVAFIAAYQTALQEGMSDPMAFAEDTVEQTQGVFNKGNRPNLARGAIGATIFTFKTFTIQYVEFLSRLPRKERALALGMLVALSGIRGIPFAGDAEDLVDTLAQSLGYNWHTRAEMDQWANRLLGRDLAQIAQRGFSGISGMPIDMSVRLGMADLIPGTGIAKPSETRKLDQFLEIFGVGGSFVRDALDRGEIRPIAIRNIDKGLDIAQTGMYRDTRGRKVADADIVDAIVKGLGFQPGGIGRESFAIQNVYESRALFTKVKGDINELLALGRFEKDPAKVRQAREALERWNARNPEQRIILNQDAINRRVREMGRDRKDRFIRSTPREIRGQTADAL